MNSHNGSSAISVRNLWKVFGDNPEKIVNSSDADLSRSELRAKTGNTAAVKDVSFDVSPQITKDIAGANTTPEKWGKRMVYAKVAPAPKK